MSVRAVLFDIGGPIDTEVRAEALADGDLRAALLAEGVAVDDDAFRAAVDHAVESFAPDAYRSVLFTLAGFEEALARRAYARFASPAAVAARRVEAGSIELRPGIAEFLLELKGRGLLLGLAANQPVAAIEDLDQLGLAQLFTHRTVAGHHGFRKPDVRLFLAACSGLGVEPAECIMVGDRVDNDIVPARSLGMRTVLFRTGRHAAQRPRSWDEMPDATAEDVGALGRAVGALLR